MAEIDPLDQISATVSSSAGRAPAHPAPWQFAKGVSGNPKGRPAGSRNKSTLLARSILEQATGAVTDKTVAVALEGHPLALKLCMERIMPRPRDATVEMEVPSITSAAEGGQAIDAILAAVAVGDISPARPVILTFTARNSSAQTALFARAVPRCHLNNQR